MSIKTDLKLQVPRPPNFIFLETGEPDIAEKTKLPLSSFTDEELRAIGVQIGEAMVMRAKQMRNSNVQPHRKDSK